jgi:two-component sensor histidine kinase
MLNADPIDRHDAELTARFRIPHWRFVFVQTGLERFRLLRGWCTRFCSVLFDHDPLNVIERIGIAALLYLAAVLGREALHLLMPGSVRYLTFFPALLTSALLCGLFPSIALLSAFAMTGFFWIEPGQPTAPLLMHFVLVFTFALAGAGVIVPAVYGVNAHRRLIQQDKYLSLLNNELHHRLKNLFSVTSSICIHSLKQECSQQEISRNIIGRIQAIASAQDFLSITSKKCSNLCDLLQAIVGPLCPTPARLRIAGEAAALPADITTSFALVLHELSTNAIKYGAWRSDCAGTVEIAWRVDSDRLSFTWYERGVQVSTIPRKRGFGSKLFQSSLGGTEIEHKLRPDGVECTISVKPAV